MVMVMVMVVMARVGNQAEVEAAMMVAMVRVMVIGLAILRVELRLDEPRMPINFTE